MCLSAPALALKLPIPSPQKAFTLQVRTGMASTPSQVQALSRHTLGAHFLVTGFSGCIASLLSLPSCLSSFAFKSQLPGLSLLSNLDTNSFKS